MKKATLKKFHTVCFHLHNILNMVTLEIHRADGQLPGMQTWKAAQGSYSAGMEPFCTLTVMALHEPTHGINLKNYACIHTRVQMLKTQHV